MPRPAPSSSCGQGRSICWPRSPTAKAGARRTVHRLRAGRGGDRRQPCRPCAARPDARRLHRSGTADLTAHVAVRRLAHKVRSRAGARGPRPHHQAEFLGGLGAPERAARPLGQRHAGQGRTTSRRRCQRLMPPTGMGQLFKVLADRRADPPPPPPFGLGTTACSSRLRHRGPEAAAGIRHGFFTRHGGVSPASTPHSTAARLGTTSDRRAENRGRVASSHLRREGLATAYQIHSTDRRRGDALGRGERPRADAMVTARRRAVAVGVLAADCAPVLFADPVARVVAAAHAGWRGAWTGCWRRRSRPWGACPPVAGGFRAAVGPCISGRLLRGGDPNSSRSSWAKDASSRPDSGGPPPGPGRTFDLPACILLG